MREKYYTFTLDEDGDFSMHAYSDIETLMEAYGVNEEDEGNPDEWFKERISDEMWGTVVVRGVLMIPKPKKVVRKWEFVEGE